MPNILQTFLPWILFFILSGQSTSSIEIASIVALISHVILNRNMIKRRFILDVGGLTFFLLFTLNVFLFKYSPVTDNAYLLSNLALALIVWLSLIIKKPFTLQYARLNTSLEVQSSELFLFINYCLTFIWAILFTLMIIPTLISPLIHATYFNDINIGINILLVVTGIWLTQHLPDWLANRLISKHTKINIKAIFKKEKQKEKNYTAFNAEKIKSTSSQTVDVIIVGAGPVGLLSALLLQRHGIKVIVVEKHPGTSIHPKARGISCRSMELFRRLGLAQKIQGYNLPDSQRWFGWFKTLTGKCYGQLTSTTDHTKISPCQTASAAQIYIEKTLLESFQKNGGEILFEHEVTDLAQDNTITQLTVLDKKTQQTHYLQAQYIVAADGAHSTLRQLLTIPMIGPATISTNVSVFCEIDLNNIIDKDKRFNIAHIIRQDGPMPLVLSVYDEKQWIFIFPSTGSNVDALKSIYTDDYLKNKIHKIIGNKTVDINIISKQVWPLGSQIANQFTAGRILFVGDSIHQFSPTGGMGMNTGLDDADNLMWKLAYVIQGKTHPDILNSYVIERLPIILTNMDWSLKNLHRIIKIRQLLSKQDIDKIDIQPIIQAQQAHLDKSGLDLGVIYESDYIMKSDIDMPIIAANNYQPTTYPGSRLPHFELIRNSTTISSLDLISTEFVMLCETNAVSHAKQIDFKTIITRIIAIDDTNNTYEKEPGTFQKLHELNKSAALWVRPDGHIIWKGELNKADDIKNLDELIQILVKK